MVWPFFGQNFKKFEFLFSNPKIHIVFIFDNFRSMYKYRVLEFVNETEEMNVKTVWTYSNNLSFRVENKLNFETHNKTLYKESGENW